MGQLQKYYGQLRRVAVRGLDCDHVIFFCWRRASSSKKPEKTLQDRKPDPAPYLSTQNVKHNFIQNLYRPPIHWRILLASVGLSTLLLDQDFHRIFYPKIHQELLSCALLLQVLEALLEVFSFLL